MKKILFCVLAAALTVGAAIPSRAQKFCERVRLSIDRPDGRYAAGEKIDVYVESDTEADLSVQVYLNGIVQKKKA